MRTCFLQQEMVENCKYLQNSNMTIINTNFKICIVTKWTPLYMFITWSKSWNTSPGAFRLLVQKRNVLPVNYIESETFFT